MTGGPDRRIGALLLFSTGSFALTYATAIVFARAMGADGYDDYAVAISSVAILATLAEMGMGKTFRPWDVDQIWLFRPSVKDPVPPCHPAMMTALSLLSDTKLPVLPASSELS